MRVSLWTLLCGLVLLSGQTAAVAQHSNDNDQRTIIDQVESFGRTLLGTPNRRERAERPAAEPRSDSFNLPTGKFSANRPAPRSNNSGRPTPADDEPASGPTMAPSYGGEVARSGRQSLIPSDGGPTPENTAPIVRSNEAPAMQRRPVIINNPTVTTVTPSAVNSAPTMTSTAAPSDEGDVPLYRRMSAYRQAAPAATAETARTEPARTEPASQRSVIVTNPASTSASSAPSSAISSGSLYGSSNTQSAPTPAASISSPTPAAPIITGAVANRPSTVVTAPRTQTIRAAGANVSGDDRPATAPAARSVATPAKSEPVVAPPTSNVLVTRQSPNLSVETIGPRRISVGKESTYEVTIRNASDVPAEELMVLVDLPSTADVVGAEPTLGRVQTADSAGTRQLQWKVGRLDGRASQRMALRLIPRQSRPFDLAIRFDYKQATTQAMIEVQQPKLAVGIDGPREVLFGKKEIYRLKLANTGNGDAENLMLRLHPLGSAGQPSQHSFGTLAAGQEKTVEIELTARQTGTLTIKIEAQCDGGVRGEASEPVLVRRANLQVETEGPKFLYVNANGTYRLRVSNSGNAPSQQTSLAVVLPLGSKAVAASDGGQAEGDGKIVRWRLDTLMPGAQRTVELKLNNTQPGRVRLDVVATADDDLSARTELVSRVEAMADLGMEVTDPQGPVALGEDAVYEIRLINRGTQTAESVDVAVFFSQGVEPVSADGCPQTITPGQVTFNAIPSLDPGKDIRLKIVAKAQVAGSHIFRAEVHCRPLGARLVSEKTTRFYASDETANSVGAVTGSPQPLRTADRPNYPPPRAIPVDDTSRQLTPTPAYRQ